MTSAAIIVLAIAAAGCLWLGVEVVRELRTPTDLRGDWWVSFEREFRAYSERQNPPSRSGT